MITAIPVTPQSAPSSGPTPPGFVPDPQQVANKGHVTPEIREIPLFSSIFGQGTDSRGDASFTGTSIWAADTVVGHAAGYSSLADATAAAAMLSRDDAGAVVVMPSETGFVLRPALAGAYGDTYAADATAANGWRWVSGVRDGLRPLHLASPDARDQDAVKLLPWLGLRPGTSLLEYRSHTPAEILVVDGDGRGTLSLEFGLQVR